MVLTSPFTISFWFHPKYLCPETRRGSTKPDRTYNAHCITSRKRQNWCWPEIVPESSGLGDSVSKEHDIWFEDAATLSTRWEVEVFTSSLQLHITIRPSDWNVDFPIWLHDHIPLLKHYMCCHNNGAMVCTQSSRDMPWPTHYEETSERIP